MTIINVTIDTNTMQDPETEVLILLRDITERVDQNRDIDRNFTLYDINGNRVGQYATSRHG